MSKINVTFISTAILEDLRAGTQLEERYEAGSSHELDAHRAVRWVRRTKALFNSAEDAEAARAVTGWSGPDTIISSDNAHGSVEPGESYEKMTRAELDAIAGDRGIDISSAKNKADVIQALTDFDTLNPSAN